MPGYTKQWRGRILGKHIILFLIAILSPCTSFADFFLHRWENHQEAKGVWGAKLEGMYYSTSKNFDHSGSAVPGTGLTSYLRNQNDLTLSVGLLNWLSVYGRLGWAYIWQDGTARPGVGYGFADQTLGLAVRAFKFEGGRSRRPRTTTLDFQLQTDFPAYQNATSTANSTPDLGDGTVDVTGGFFLGVPFHADHQEGLNATVGAGYTFRTGGFSSAIPWIAYLEYSPADDGILGRIGASGIFSLRTDPNGQTAPLRSSIGSGNSFITGGGNPALLQIDARVGYQIDPNTQFLFFISQSVWGQYSPAGLTLSLAFQKRFGALHPTALTMSPSEYGKSNRGFLNYSLDAKVLKSNDRLNLLKINKGIQDGVEVGQIFDIFIVKRDGSTGDSIARAEVTNVKFDEAALEITEFYKEVWIEEGYLAKRLVQ